MERTENTQNDVIEVEDIASRTFIFSEPSVLRPPEAVNSEVILEQVSDASVVPNVFTFTAPTAVSQASNHDASAFHSSMCDKQYKPKISRNTYKPAVNVFAQALKDTAMFEHLKKNSRSQAAKINPENSITCSNVPQSLLTKVAAKEYFMLFGNLSKIAIRPKKQIITVTYATKEEACVAYEKSGDYLGEKFHIEWTKLCVSPKSPTKKKDMQKNFVSNFLKSSANQLELHAMMSQKHTRPGNYKEKLDGMLSKKNKLSQPKGTKSTARVEKASAKSDKLKSDSQITYLSPNATTEELQSIICQPAHTSADKYKVLEARDRLIRMKQVKSHTLEAAKVMAGTCPDMCPEKERLMRESKRQVALYELLDTNEYRVNHAVAVKQYSRSSADQEEPMAHDLRPVKSLKMTMSYLLHEIGNLCDQPGTNLGEWYHFLWDRTRGIRKDITQQELCCTSSVELVEQCARFHIVCSERLCAEEASIFDKRINSDNLTKCLQSLKYMYHDLRVKGINCKNESEFRTYIILLNLNNGNFMWDLQRLPKSVQKSAEVRFALEVYSALESNNYYKFFKLVRKTTYLNACILLRYFNQVRLKALSIMVKAYCRTTSTAYPLYELIDILAFEDENEAIYFCEQIGLNASKDELHVLLNRQNFTMPVLNIKQNRACNIIESKRTMQQLSIGECIAGGKMPERTYKYHKPHNSFDSHGFLMSGSINAQDQSETAISTPNDPYEFIEDDVMETKKSTSISEKSYNKTESTGTSDHTNVFKSVTSIEPTANVFAIVKSDTNASFTATPETQMKESQKNVNLLAKSKTEKEKDSNMFSFAQKQQDVILNVNKSSKFCTVGNAFDTTTSSKTSNIFSKSFEPSSNNDVASPFSIAASKSIFSGTPQENIFMKNLAPSTIFSNTYSNMQTVPKSSNVTNATAFITKNKLKETESFLVRAEPVQKQSVKETNAEELKLEEQEHVKSMEQIKETAEQILNTIQAEVIQTDCSDIVGEKISRINICNKLSEDINNQISSEVTEEICNSILTEEIINTQKLHEVSIKIKNRIIMRYFNVWKSNILIKKQQRKALDGTPVWLQNYSSGQCAKVLYLKKQDLVIRNMCKRRAAQEPTKCYIESLAPIEVIIYIGIKENVKSLDANMHCNYYWKLVISWPDLHNKSILWHHKKIMNQYLYPNDHTLEPIIKFYQPNQSETLHICIRHFEGLISDHNLVGSDALLFIATASEETKFVIKRLTKTILSRDRLMPIPLVFIILGDVNVKIQEKEITASLEKMLQCGYLSTYTMMYEKDLTERTILNMTQSAVLWLTINKSPPNPLEMDYLHEIYDICLTEELWLRILDDSFFNKKLSSALKEPKFIIDLHNEAVTYLIDIILDPESFMYTKFAPEFNKFISNEYTMPCNYEHFDDTWKKEEYKVELEKVMFSFKLPEWRYGWPISDNSTLHRCITKYCQEALFDSNDDQPSCGILSNLFFTSGVTTVSNFIDVLLYIVKKKVYLLEDLKVVYNRDYIKHFRILPWWLKSSLLTEYKVVLEQLSVHGNVKRNDSNEPIVKKRKIHKLDENDVKPDPLATFCENTRSQVMDVHYTLKKVEDRLTAQRHQSILFEERLKNALYSKIDSAS